jgi:hypothetical protein
LRLRQRAKDFYDYSTPNGFEVDFYIPEQQLWVQVTQHLKKPGYARPRVAGFDRLNSISQSKGSLNLEDQFDIAAGQYDDIRTNA